MSDAREAAAGTGYGGKAPSGRRSEPGEVAVQRRPWYREVERRQWRPLAAANLGWLFDGFETYALILTVGVALRQLLPPSELPQTSFYAGAIIAITLLGWGVGGILGGIAADYLGRRRTLLYSMVLYALLTGLTALSWSWLSFAVLRFATGVAIGTEWSTGTSLVAETWPDRARAKAAGFMQCGLGIGFFIASACWYFIAPLGPSSWRLMFVLGILPAVFALWMRRRIPESERWVGAQRRRMELRERRRRRPDDLTGAERTYAGFTLRQILTDPELRRLTILGSLMSVVTTLAWWGISTWVPQYVGGIAAERGLSASDWASRAGMIYNVGAIAGYISLGFMADRFGRKPTVIFFFGASLVLTPVLFLWIHDLALVAVVTLVNGFFTLGQYSWMPVWLPEFYPTHLRATGAAFVFNAARFIAFLGPLLAGTIIARLGGYGVAATSLGMIYVLGLLVAPWCPETRGRALPET